MRTLYVLMTLGGLLVAIGVVAGLYSRRVGLSHLLVFLVVGMAAGVDGPLGLPFSEYSLAFGVGNLALAIILLDGGLRTPAAALRRALWPAGLLATAGVLVTTAIVAAAATAWLHSDWRTAALLGAAVASTDASAVFGQLSRSGLKLPPRLAATIEVESGLNDPAAVFMVLSLIALIVAPGQPASASAALFARQLVLGVAFGWGLGIAVAALLRRLPIEEDHDALCALLLAAAGTVVFAGTALLEGSGFLAVYLFGVVVAGRAQRVVAPALVALNGYAWLAQAVMFLLLGLLVTPHRMLQSAAEGLALALLLMFGARPAAVFACLTPLGFGWREQTFVAWVGLRGAVPIVLSLYPVLAGVPRADLLFDTAFVVVLSSLLVQAPTIGWLARRLRIA